MSVVLVLDIGTSKLCALALSTETARPVAVRSCANDADMPGVPSGRHEQDPVRITENCHRLLKEVAAEAADPDVLGIGFSGQMHGVLLVDGDHGPLTNLITWRDQRTVESQGAGSLDAALTCLDADAPARAGCRLNAGYGGATLHWLAANDRLPEGARALTIADYVAASLTGVASTEPTHAASWGILDVALGQWDPASVERLSIPASTLPEICPSGTEIGRILPELAAELSLPGGVRVCAPVGDNQASVIGAAGLGSGAAVVNLGTGGQVSVPCREYKFIPELETRPMPLGGYILVGASLCGGWAYAYLNRFFRDVVKQVAGLDLPEDDLYARMNDLATSASDGSEGLTADTRFSGTRGAPDIRGGIAGIDRENLTAANLTRAVVEGMVRELADLGRQAGLEHLSHIIASGNAARKNPLVLQVIEKAFGLRCSLGPAGEEAALGAAFCTAVGLGLLTPEAVNRAVSAV